MLTYQTIRYKDLDLDMLYEILALRQEVFVVEQACPYLDVDGKDKGAYHVIGVDDRGIIQAYARLLDKGVSYDEYTSIGRVITREGVRGKGQGRPLMQYCIAACHKHWGKLPIKISAQAHLRDFYASVGFEPTGESYLEDNIPHIGMVYA